jgi:hypothetical protein
MTAFVTAVSTLIGHGPLDRVYTMKVELRPSMGRLLTPK